MSGVRTAPRVGDSVLVTIAGCGWVDKPGTVVGHVDNAPRPAYSVALGPAEDELVILVFATELRLAP